MNKLLVTFLTIALTLSVGSQAFATSSLSLFGDTELIRIAYDRTGSVEWATDLGSVTSLETSTNLTVGGGADAIKVSNITGATSYSDLYVAYIAIHNDTNVAANRESWASGSATTAPLSAARAFTPFQATMANVYNQYSQSGYTVQGTGSVASDQTSLLSYFAQMDKRGTSYGSFGGLTTVSNNPGGEMNLAALASGGSVTQELYQWNGLISSATAGIATLSLTTNADGSTTINAGAAPATPIPPAFFLMGSGLLGLIGFGRKSALS